jgi:hypothetical protein
MNTTERLATLDRIRKFSRLLDSAFRIPGTPFRFGIDPIIGLIPGLGDLIDTGFSTYLVLLAMRFQLPQGVLGWMVFNILVEFVVGAVPIVGDLFDAYFKSNLRNLALLEKHLQTAEPNLTIADPLNLDSVPVLNPTT